MDGFTVAVFSSDAALKARFLEAVAKKSEAEGLSVHHRTAGGAKYSFLDASDFPQRVQTYSKIASIADHGLLFFPLDGRLSAPDGELAVLASCFQLPGTLELFDPSLSPEGALAMYKGTSAEKYGVEKREPGSAAIDLSSVRVRDDFGQKGTLVSIDRAFTVKGVGTVVLGFVLSGEVKVHQQLRLVPGQQGLAADVKGIQVNDVDCETAGRGIRVGLSLRGVEPSQLDRTHWLDDGSFQVSSTMNLEFAKSPFYRQEVTSRDLHVQLPGEMLPARLAGEGGSLSLTAASEFPLWSGMRLAVVDLNGKGLRLAGGGTCKL